MGFHKPKYIQRAMYNKGYTALEANIKLDWLINESFKIVTIHCPICKKDFCKNNCSLPKQKTLIHKL